MALDSNVTLGAHQREIIDWMRETYQIEDIRIRPGGKHIHVEYVYKGKRIKDTLPRHGTRGDDWVDTRKHDLRRTLGTPPEPPAKLTRTLDEMTQALQEKVDLKTTTAVGTTVLLPPHVAPGGMRATITDSGSGKSTVPTPVLQKRFPCTVAAYKDGIWFGLGAELSAAMQGAFKGDHRFVVAFVYPATWVVRPIPAKNGSGRAIEVDKHRLRGSSADTVKQLGLFRATPAEATIYARRVEFRLLEKPHLITPAAEPEEAPVPEPVPVEAVPAVEFLPAPPIPVPAPPPPAPPPLPADPRERLLHVLRLIKAVEDEGTYRLIPDNNGWRWRAFDIVLEEEN